MAQTVLAAMSNHELVVVLNDIVERLKWPYDGEPGSNPDYLDSSEQAAIAEACRRLMAIQGD